MFTSESGLPSKNLAKVFVLAFKDIAINEGNFRVMSSVVQIQNDNLKAGTILFSLFTIVLHSLLNWISSI